MRKEFSNTEKRLIDSKLPKEILARHTAFVKNYESNLSQLKTEIDDIDKAKTKADRKAKIEKVRQHLEKVKKPSTHQKLDPENLPFRARKVSKPVAPRLTAEEYQRDFPKQKSLRPGSGQAPGKKIADSGLLPDLLSVRAQRKPVLLASNDIASDVPFLLGAVNNDTQLTLVDSSPIILAQQTADLPTPEDIAEAPPAIQFTPEIRDLAAQQLGCRPAKIFEWTHNNIDFVPTYSSIQGADMCLQTRQCNALDANALLVSMLRSCSYPSRLVYGTIELPIEKVMNWVGNFTDATAALTLMASGGIPVAAGMSGGVITKARFEHAWVETYIPYGNYRGSMRDNSLPTWIPMDGSYKSYTYSPGFDITGTVPFSQDEYLNQVQSQNAVHYYQSKIQEYLDANMPDKSIVDVKGYREIKQEKYPFLPSTLSYKVITVGGKFSSIPANMTATATFTLTNPATGSDVSYTASLPELAGKRITVSYIPATANDEALIAKYGGFLYDVPAYMLNLKGVLRVEGVIKLTGEAATLGSEQSLTMQFSQPNGLSETVNKKLIAGAYYAVGLDLQGINENVLGKRNYQLTTNVRTETAGTLGNDDLIGEYLYIRAVTYFLANDKLYKAGAKLYNTALTRTISEGITSTPLTVSYVFSIPKAATPSGVEIDVAMDRVIAVAKDGNVNKEKAYMEIAGLVSSYDEHDVFERLDEFPSVSTVRALQVAAINGIPIYTINSSNITQLLPTLQVDAEIKEEISNAVNAGKEVTISKTNVTIEDFFGVGYIVKDPISGSGAYRISGGLGGALSTAIFVGVTIVALYKGPYGWLKDRLDPQTRRNIVTAATLQIGEEILADAATIKAVDAGYEDISKCTGLVIQSYAAAGIDLVKKSKDAGFGNPYNVSVLYLFVNSRPEFIVGAEGPIWGDIAFFKNTYPRTSDMRRAGDNNVTHVGIVSSVLDGQVYSMIHAANKTRNIVDDIFANGMLQNTYWGPNFLSFGRPR